MGLTEDDINQLSDKFIDTTFAWGSAEAIKARIQAHLDAGANHVCIQPVNPNGQFGDLHWGGTQGTRAQPLSLAALMLDLVKAVISPDGYRGEGQPGGCPSKLKLSPLTLFQ